MMTEAEQAIAIDGIKIYAHGVGTVNPPKLDTETEEEEG